MKKFKNWFMNSRIYGACLLVASLCIVAFGGAYLGANMAIDGHQVTVEVEVPDDIQEGKFE